MKIEDTVLNTWFERGRAHVCLEDKHTGHTILEFWDSEYYEAIEDGYLNPRKLHETIYNTAVGLGLL